MIEQVDLSGESELIQLARDVFMFSFYARGMAFVDMCYLKRRICGSTFFPTGVKRPDNYWK